jgi:5-methyltetrahydropteroyltriglutamate--homocysteine methyltransferase
MKRSTDRILTTHTGSLPRPPDLFNMLRAAEAGRPPGKGALQARARSAVAEAVQQQAEAGVDVVSDGEQAKPGFYVYVRDRLKGLEGIDPASQPFVNPDFPGYNTWREERGQKGGGPPGNRPVCIGPLSWKDRASLDADIQNLKSALRNVDVTEAFIPSASASLLAQRIENRYYATYEAYLGAMVDVMKVEYRAIVDAGLLLQIDAPEMALEPSLPQFRDRPLSDFKKYMALWVEALNSALDGIDPERVRFHVCWGNNEAPHTRDVALGDIVDMVLRINAGAYLIEAANPRHEHEWRVWEDARLPDGKILIPGVIDSTTNFVEHPELVAQRIERFAAVVGKENVIAGTDCGFGTWAITDMIYPPIVWAKLAALSDGARIASNNLWNRREYVAASLSKASRTENR